MSHQETAEIEELIQRVIEEGSIASTDTSYSFLCPRIQEGMYIVKSMDSTDPKDDIFIFLDNLDCTNDFLSTPNRTMQTIIDYFDTTKPGYVFVNRREDSSGRKIVTWGQVVQDRVGQCLEMAIMSQLLFQRNNHRSFLCGGRSSLDTSGTHAWNLKKKEGRYFIWDCALGLYAPLDRLELREGGLDLHPDYEKSIGNKERIVYRIGGE